MFDKGHCSVAKEDSDVALDKMVTVAKASVAVVQEVKINHPYNEWQLEQLFLFRPS